MWCNAMWRSSYEYVLYVAAKDQCHLSGRAVPTLPNVFTLSCCPRAHTPNNEPRDSVSEETGTRANKE